MCRGFSTSVLFIVFVDESHSGSAFDDGLTVVREKFKVDLNPEYATRLKIFKAGQQRPILVPIKLFEERFTVDHHKRRQTAKGSGISNSPRMREREGKTL